MKIFVNICLVLLLMVSVAFAERVVIPESEVERVGLENILNKPSAKLIGKSKLGVYIFEIHLEDLKELGIKEYKVEKKKKLISSLPNDLFISEQWSVSKTSLDKLWDSITDCSEVIIAVVDTGIDYNHIDLIENIYQKENEICDNDQDDDGNGYVDDCIGWDFENDDNDPFDDSSHGTHVAGIIGAVGNNNIGVSGVCQKVKLLNVKVLDKNGDGYDSNVALGIVYAVDSGAKVVNLSLESSKLLPMTYNAISYAEEKNVIVVMAAGNADQDIDIKKIYPAVHSLDFDNAITVGNSNIEDKRGTKSDFGSISTDIFAPGENIISTYPDDKVSNKTGTSMAAPFISGVVGLLLSYNDNLNRLSFFDVKKRIISSADSISTLKGLSIAGGRINASKILDETGKPVIVKVFPGSYGVDGSDSLRPMLNELIELYGDFDGVYQVFYNNQELSFTKAGINTKNVNTPLVSGDFYIKVLNSYGYSNEVKISPYINKIILNSNGSNTSDEDLLSYSIESGSGATIEIREILDDDMVDNYTVVNKGIKFYIKSSNNTENITINKSSTAANSIAVDALLRTDSGAIICLEKSGDTYYKNNISTNSSYSFYEVAEACQEKEASSGGGGGCSMSFGAFNNIILLIVGAFLRLIRNYLFVM